MCVHTIVAVREYFETKVMAELAAVQVWGLTTLI
jgi:hypothetical protein